MRIILDTNVWVSGLLLPTSNAGTIIKKWQTFKFESVSSPYILQEIAKVLTYPKIENRLKWDHTQIQTYLDLLSFYSEVVAVSEIVAHVKTDPKDSPILSTLIISHADFLVSGDNDLLDLKDEYPILTIVEFLRKLEGY